MIHFKLNFACDAWYKSNFYFLCSFAHEHPIVSEMFVAKIIHSLLNCLCTFAKMYWPFMHDFISVHCILLFLMPISSCLNYCSSINLKVRCKNSIFISLSFLFIAVWDFLDPLYFLMNSRTILSMHTIIPAWILMGTECWIL